jgi:predicted Fe-S protein YdhL (DUF1289 family)
MKVDSPCIQVCQLDGREVCLGCYRTRDEIARWTQMTEAEKFQVVSILAARRGELSPPLPVDFIRERGGLCH